MREQLWQQWCWVVTLPPGPASPRPAVPSRALPTGVLCCRLLLASSAQPMQGGPPPALLCCCVWHGHTESTRLLLPHACLQLTSQGTARVTEQDSVHVKNHFRLEQSESSCSLTKKKKEKKKGGGGIESTFLNLGKIHTCLKCSPMA